jgi:hypothetical protein
MGMAITYNQGKIYAGGFGTDTTWVNEDMYTIILDTSGNALAEWRYNGRGMQSPGVRSFRPTAFIMFMLEPR